MTGARDEVLRRLRALGYSERDAQTLAEYFLEAEAHGKRGHGLLRIDQLESVEGLRPDARPQRVFADAALERWEARGAVGYLVLAAICDALVAAPPKQARL